jgi:hypothetical protein
MLLGLITVFASNVFSQTNDSNTATTAQPPAAAPSPEPISVDATISYLLTQNETAREVITRQKQRINDLEAEGSVERENSDSLSKSYTSAKSEIASLKQSNEALARAVAINEDTISKLAADNSKQREKAKKATREKWRAYAIAGGILVLKIFVF